jgi:hypothetical protein
MDGALMIVEVWFPIQKDSDGYPKSRDSEGLRCEISDERNELAEVQSVPFYLKEVAYGDIVRIKRNPAGYREFDGVERRSGCSVYRLLVHDATRLDEVQEKLLDFGVFLERDGSLIAIAVPPDVHSDALVAYIIEGKRSGLWGSQDGYIGD